MAHVSEGRLRRLADEPVAITDLERQHVSECAKCRSRAAAAAADRDAMARALANEDPPADVDATWAAVNS